MLASVRDFKASDFELNFLTCPPRGAPRSSSAFNLFEFGISAAASGPRHRSYTSMIRFSQQALPAAAAAEACCLGWAAQQLSAWSGLQDPDLLQLVQVPVRGYFFGAVAILMASALASPTRTSRRASIRPPIPWISALSSFLTALSSLLTTVTFLSTKCSRV